MSGRRLFLAGVACVGLSGAAVAGQNDVLIGLDSKVLYDESGQRNGAPGIDTLLVMDISSPVAPRIRASLELPNSLVGPPTNLEITPDGRFGLVANSVVHVADGAGWKTQPDDKLFVIDLEANPPKLVDTVTVGRQPSGLDIATDGKMALIANRAGKSISVVSIEGGRVKHLGDVELGQEAAAVAIAPDAKRAFVVLNLANKVAVLDIDGQKVSYDKANDIPVGFNPYNIDITPDGRFAIASGTGGGKDNADAVTTIAITGAHPHVVGLTTIGVGPEGIAVSPDGKYLVAALLRGTGAKKSDYFYTKQGEAVLVALGADGSMAVKDRAPLGGLPEGLAFSLDSQFVYIGNYIDKTMQVFHVSGGRLQMQGGEIALPGQPASMRGVAR